MTFLVRAVAVVRGRHVGHSPEPAIKIRKRGKAALVAHVGNVLIGGQQQRAGIPNPYFVQELNVRFAGMHPEMSAGNFK